MNKYVHPFLIGDILSFFMPELWETSHKGEKANVQAELNNLKPCGTMCNGMRRRRGGSIVL